MTVVSPQQQPASDSDSDDEVEFNPTVDIDSLPAVVQVINEVAGCCSGEIFRVHLPWTLTASTVDLTACHSCRSGKMVV